MDELRIKAQTQYDDWSGTASADADGASLDLMRLFEQAGEVDSEKETLVAFEFFISEPMFTVGGYFAPAEPESLQMEREAAEYDETVQLRKVDLEIERDDFLKLLERLNVVLVRRGHQFAGLKYKLIKQQTSA